MFGARLHVYIRNLYFAALLLFLLHFGLWRQYGSLLAALIVQITGGSSVSIEHSVVYLFPHLLSVYAIVVGYTAGAFPSKFLLTVVQYLDA